MPNLPPTPTAQVDFLEIIGLMNTAVCMRFLGAGTGEIAKDLEVDRTQLQNMLNSDVAKAALRAMKKEEIAEAKTLKQEMDDILLKNVEVPKALIKGRIKQISTVTDVDGVESEEEVEVTVPLELRLKAYASVAKIAGYGGATQQAVRETNIYERIEKIKERAAKQGVGFERTTVEKRTKVVETIEVEE